MKKITLLLSLISLFIGAKAQTFSDDFEADTLGKLGPQSAVWTTWSNDDGGAEDVDVVDTDNHTPAGTKSIYFSSTSSNGGPTDCILPFSGTPLSTGKFSFTSWFKIPSGKTAYFNFQGDTTLGDVFTLECSMEGGYLYISNDGNDVVSVEHPVDTWFKLTIDVNLNTNKWNLLIDDVVKGTWKNAVDLIVAVDFYPANKNASYWVDDVSFNITPYVLPAVNGAANAIAVPAALVGQSRKLNFTARNLGQATITSFDLSVTQNNGTPVTQSFSGLNIPSYEMATVIIDTPFTLTPQDKFTAIISNVNGGGADGDAIDDTTSIENSSVVPAPGKTMFAEGIVGTWCEYCPSGMVYMDYMM
ncbi:MAG TPA: hypothetical protein VLB84_08665 [Bacteroidia bacterium]|nr:hypothetical protein [Bacteroidia bacterium]